MARGVLGTYNKRYPMNHRNYSLHEDDFLLMSQDTALNAEK